MSIWGSLIGGMVGFSLGGPFGMLLGSLIGGKISRARSGAGFRSFAQPQQIFALSLIVLSAKLSKADGNVSKEELVAVKDKLKIPEHEIDQVGKIFNQAKKESTGYEPYAQQIAQIYKNNLNVLEEVVNILFYIAEADGDVSQSELKMISNIAQIFGLSSDQFNSIKEIKQEINPSNEIVNIPKNEINVSVDDAKKVLKLIDALEDNDDVQNVYANCDIPDEVMNEIEEE